jgi:hypothetical protein
MVDLPGQAFFVYSKIALERAMKRVELILGALCISFVSAQAQSPPQPPKGDTADITDQECLDWKKAIASGHTLSPQEQGRYAQCIIDVPFPGGKKIAPPVEVYDPTVRQKTDNQI